MNKHLSRTEIAAIAVDLETRLDAELARPRKRHGEPFAKRAEGRDRRKARRARQAERMAWLNS